MDTNDTFQVEVEYTDTFGGEANYCWVKRETLTPAARHLQPSPHAPR
jgi:hypothetical protein